MRKLRIGVVGAGAIVRHRHVPGIAAHGGGEIVAVSNASIESAATFCREHAPEAEVIPDWQALVARPDLDIVWIGTGPFLHAPVTLAALEADRHVFCQARMAESLASAQAMQQAAAQNPRLVTMLCPPPQGLENDAFIRTLLAQNKIGELRHVFLQSFNAGFLDPTQPAHWRQRREISGIQVLTLGIYTEVLQRWVGAFTPQAARGKIFVSERSGYRVTIPDALTVLVGFANGATGCLEMSGVHAGPPRERIEITGTAGALVLDFLADTITFHPQGSDQGEHLEPPAGMRRPWRVEADFLDAVRNVEGPRPVPGFAEGLAYMEVVDRVARLLEA